MEKQKNKKNIIIIILLLVIALLVIYIFFGQFILNYFNKTTETPSTEQASRNELQDLADQVFPETGGDLSEGVVPEASSDAIIASQMEDLFANPDNYAGKNVQIEGTVYKEPVNNQGILIFNIEVGEGRFALINYLDPNEKMDLKKNQTVTIKGIVTGSVSSQNIDSQPTMMPMVNASELGIVN